MEFTICEHPADFNPAADPVPFLQQADRGGDDVRRAQRLTDHERKKPLCFARFCFAETSLL